MRISKNSKTIEVKASDRGIKYTVTVYQDKDRKQRLITKVFNDNHDAEKYAQQAVDNGNYVKVTSDADRLENNFEPGQTVEIFESTKIVSSKNVSDTDQAVKYIKAAIDVLGKSGSKDSVTKDSIANLATVMFDLKGSEK